MKETVLVLGGCRSGKSRYALTLASRYRKKAFIATATPFDEEMRQRIRAHKRERRDEFITYEEPHAIGEAIRSLPSDIEVAVVDCLTVWLGNLWVKKGTIGLDTEEVKDFLTLLASPPCPLIIVSNEIGLGVVPPDPETRRFRDVAGGVNQRVAALARRVFFMVGGIPLRVKG